MMKPLSPLLILQSAGILFLFSDYSWSIVNLYVSSGSPAYANFDRISTSVYLKLKIEELNLRRTNVTEIYRNILL